MTGEDLRAVRESHGLTQRQMGDVLGYNENYILRLERGHAPITKRVEKLTLALLGHKKVKKSSPSP